MQQIDPKIDRFVNQRCYYYLQQVRQQLNLSNISNAAAELLIDENNNLIFTIGGTAVFSVTPAGTIYGNKIMIDDRDLLQIISAIETGIQTMQNTINSINLTLATVVEKVAPITVEDDTMTIAGDVIVNDINIGNTLEKVDMRTTDIRYHPTLNMTTIADNVAITATSTSFTNTTMMGTLHFPKVIYAGDKMIDTDTICLVDNDNNVMNVDGFITSNNYTLTLDTSSLSNSPASIALIQSDKIINSNGFKIGNYTLSTPSLTTNRTIATTADLPTDYLSTGNSSQIVTGTKRFYELRVGDGISTDAYIGIHDSYGIRAFSFPKVYGRLMADTDGVTTNTIQSITKQKTFKSGIIVDSGGTAVFANSFREIRSAINDSLSSIQSHYLPSSTGTLINENYASSATPTSVGSTASYGSGTSYARANHSHAVNTSIVCTLTATQTLKNKTLDSPKLNFPNFNSVTYTDTWYNTTYLNSGGRRYDMGKLHIYLLNTTWKINLSGSTSALNLVDINHKIPLFAPIFTQCQTWYGEKGMYTYCGNPTYGYLYTINAVGVIAGQRLYMFCLWFDD